MTLASFAQKKELKMAEKAIKKQNFSAAMSALKTAEPLIANADKKYQTKYYFLKGQVFANKKDYKAAAKALNKLLDLEKKSKKFKYTSKAGELLNKMIKEVSERSIANYNKKDYKAATEDFYLTYLLSPKDTTFLYNAAVSASLAKDYDTSLKHYNKLKEIGYKGIVTTYEAIDKETKKPVAFGSKNEMDLMVKSGKYENPKIKKTDSKQATIIKSIAYLLKSQGKVEEAILAVQEARAANPKDLNLLLTEADLYVKLGKMDEFAKMMKKAIEMSPNDPTLYYNLGVVNYKEKRFDEAKKYYKKAIELKSDYADAYTNLAVVILSKEKEIIDEMNKNLDNFKKYEELEKQQKEVYKEALPYLEKADALNRSIDTVRGLLNIYDILEMDAKSEEYRALYKKMKNK